MGLVLKMDDSYFRRPGCCIVCGGLFLGLLHSNKVFDEREEWQSYRLGCSYMVNAEDFESMYFHRRPMLWLHFYRAS
jgi:hypothetical protein